MENQNPVYVFATWKIQEGQIENVLELLKTVQKESVKEQGNLFYKIHQVNSDLNTIVLYEGYTNELAVAEHRSSVYFQDILAAKIVPLLEQREVILTTLIE
jgi:quinol monooxygenase YgiN